MQPQPTDSTQPRLHPSQSLDLTDSDPDRPTRSSTTTVPVSERPLLQSKNTSRTAYHPLFHPSSPHQSSARHGQDRITHEERGGAKGVRNPIEPLAKGAGTDAATTNTARGCQPAMSSLPRSRKPNAGGFKPLDTLTPPQPNADRPKWMNPSTNQATYSRLRAPGRLNGSRQGGIRPVKSSPVHITHPEEPSPKRQKVDTDASRTKQHRRQSFAASPVEGFEAPQPPSSPSPHHDPFNGQSRTYRSVEAIVNSAKSSKSSSSRTPPSHQSSRGSSNTSPSRETNGVSANASHYHVDEEMMDDEPHVKHVFSPTAEAHASINQQLEFRHPAVTASSDFTIKGRREAEGINGGRQPGQIASRHSSRPYHAMGRNDDDQADSPDQLARDGPPQQSRTVVMEEPSPTKPQRTPSHLQPDHLQSPQKHPQGDLERPSQGLRHQFVRDEPDHDTIEQSDPLQAEVNIRSSSKPLSVTSAQSVKRAPRSRIPEISDGFSDSEIQSKDLASIRRDREKKDKLESGGAGPEIAKKTFRVRNLIDRGNFQQDVSMYASNSSNGQALKYTSPASDGGGSIPLSRITKVHLSPCYARLLGTKTQNEQFDVIMQFPDAEASTGFKAACNVLHLRRYIDAKQWHEHHDDNKLAKTFDNFLNMLATDNSVTGREELAVLKKRQAKFDRVASSVSARKDSPQTDRFDEHGQGHTLGSYIQPSKLKNRMEDGEGKATQSRPEEVNQAKATKDISSPVRTAAVGPGRGTRSKEQPDRSRQSTSMSKDVFEEVPIRFSQTIGLGTQWKRSLVYPAGAKRTNVATVDWDDLERLDEGEFLNDNLIAFGLRWALDKARPEVKKRIHVFNSYFYTSLTQNAKRGEINYESVKRWTLKLAHNLFEYDYIVVPVNESYHWHVAIICNVGKLNLDPGSAKDDSASRPPTAADETRDSSRHSHQNGVSESNELLSSLGGQRYIERKTSQMSIDDDRPITRNGTTSRRSQNQTYSDEIKYDGPDDVMPAESRNEAADLGKRKKAGPEDPVIITCDSFGGQHSEVTRVLKQYLKKEALDKRQCELRFVPSGLTAKGIPLQNNFSDCGLYLIAYIEQFLQDPDNFVTKVVNREMNEEQDWPNFNATTLRDSYRTVVLAEGKRQNNLPLSQGEEQAIDGRELSKMADKETFAQQSQENGTGKPKKVRKKLPIISDTDDEEGSGSDYAGAPFYNAFGNTASTDDEKSRSRRQRKSEAPERGLEPQSDPAPPAPPRHEEPDIDDLLQGIAQEGNAEVYREEYGKQQAANDDSYTREYAQWQERHQDDHSGILFDNEDEDDNEETVERDPLQAFVPHGFLEKYPRVRVEWNERRAAQERSPEL